MVPTFVPVHHRTPAALKAAPDFLEGQRRLFVSKTGSLPETTVIVDSHLFPMPVVLPLSYCLEAMKSAYCSDGKNSSLWKYVMAAFVLTESLNKFLVNRGIYKSFIMA